MKPTAKSEIFLLILIFNLLIFPFNAKSTAVINDSTFPADEGEIYTWKCTYNSPYWSTFLGVGSRVDVKINQIYQGSYGGAEQALIINVTLNYDINATDYHHSINFPYYLVYDEIFHYMLIVHSFIILTPINLTLIADYIIRSGDNASIQGNYLNVDYGYNRTGQYLYNSNGFATKFEYMELGITQYILELVGREPTIDLVGREPTIDLGFSYILFSIISIIFIGISVKKHYLISKRK